MKDDHLNSYLTCLGNEKAMGKVFNFCTGRGVSIAQLTELIKGIIGFKGEVIWNTIPERPLNIANLVGEQVSLARSFRLAKREG